MSQLFNFNTDKDAEQESRPETLHRALADEIINGVLSPGTRLDEVSIAQRFGVSRTPVREALQRLVASGLADKRPHRGVVVAVISRQRLHEMFEVMIDMETLCAGYAAVRMAAPERQALEKAHRESSHLAQQGNRETYIAFNNSFHEAIYRGAHNAFLEDAALAIRRRLAPFRTAQFQFDQRLVRSFEEHDNIVTAILRGDADNARLAMRSHVTAVGEVSETFAADRIGPTFPASV